MSGVYQYFERILKLFEIEYGKKMLFYIPMHALYINEHLERSKNYTYFNCRFIILIKLKK